MPIYSIQTPNGSVYDIEAPEGATERELFGYVNYLIGKEVDLLL